MIPDLRTVPKGVITAAIYVAAMGVDAFFFNTSGPRGIFFGLLVAVCLFLFPAIGLIRGGAKAFWLILWFHGTMLPFAGFSLFAGFGKFTAVAPKLSPAMQTFHGLVLLAGVFIWPLIYRKRVCQWNGLPVPRPFFK